MKPGPFQHKLKNEVEKIQTAGHISDHNCNFITIKVKLPNPC